MPLGRPIISRWHFTSVEEKTDYSVNGVGIIGLSWTKTDKLSKLQPNPHIYTKILSKWSIDHNAKC